MSNVGDLFFYNCEMFGRDSQPAGLAAVVRMDGATKATRDIVPTQPVRPFHNSRGLKSGDWRILCISGTSYDGL